MSAIVEQLHGDEDKVRTSSRAAAQMTLDEDGIEEISPALFAHIGFNRKSNALKVTCSRYPAVTALITISCLLVG